MLINVKGGGRNTGIRAARGQFIAFIDCDDHFVEGALGKLLQMLQENPHLDVLTYDYIDINTITGEKNCCSQQNSIKEMSGSEFINSQKVSWMGCLFALKKEFLFAQHIQFAEYVRFEDEDFALKCVARAKSIRYAPLQIFYYIHNPEQTSSVNNSLSKVTDMFKAMKRTEQLAIEESATNQNTCNILLGHHWFMYKSTLMRYLWRLSPKHILSLLCTYRPYTPCPSKLLTFCAKHPRIVGCCLIAAKPILPLVRKVYLKNR